MSEIPSLACSRSCSDPYTIYTYKIATGAGERSASSTTSTSTAISSSRTRIEDNTVIVFVSIVVCYDNILCLIGTSSKLDSGSGKSGHIYVFISPTQSISGDAIDR